MWQVNKLLVDAKVPVLRRTTVLLPLGPSSLFAQYCDKWRGEIDIHAGNFQECRSMPIVKEIYVRSK